VLSPFLSPKCLTWHRYRAACFGDIFVPGVFSGAPFQADLLRNRLRNNSGFLALRTVPKTHQCADEGPGGDVTAELLPTPGCFQGGRSLLFLLRGPPGRAMPAAGVLLPGRAAERQRAQRGLPCTGQGGPEPTDQFSGP